jgi:putative ABC transport system permease protein
MIERIRSGRVTLVRGLRSSPWLFIAALITLAGSAGMNVAMVGLVDRALLSPPGHLTDPGHLFALGFDHQTPDGSPQRMVTTSYPTFRQLAADVPALERVAAWQSAPASVTIDGDQVRADAMLVSSGYFQLLGTTPALGPGMPEGDLRAVAVISHAFWTKQFGADVLVLGRRLRVRGMDFEVAGVMPRGFGGHASASVDLWLPLEVAMSGTPGWDTAPRNIVSVLARVGNGGTAMAAGQATAALGQPVAFVPLLGGEVGAQDRRIAYWLLAVSTVVLLLGLSNVGTLLVIRASRRRRESAVRAALGASRARLIVDVAVESIVFAALAAAISVVLSVWLDESVRRVLLPGVIEQTGVSTRTLLATVVAGLAAGIVAAVAGISALPLRFRSEDFHSASSVNNRRVQTALLLIQTTASVVLLTGAGMIARSLWNLISQDFGIQTANVMVIDFERGPGAIPGQDEVFNTALGRVRALPGVLAATAFQSLPFAGFHVPPISVPGRPEPNVDQQLPFLIAATPELRDILGITLSAGRWFTASDEHGSLPVVVNETMAAAVWPGERAVGKCIRIGFDPDFDLSTADGPPVPSAKVPCREVIGVAHDVRQRSVVPTGSEAALMQYYVPFAQVPGPPPGLPEGPRINGVLVRTSGPVPGLTLALRRSITSGHVDLPYVRVRPYADLFDRQLRPWKVGTTLLAIFSALAVGIATVGLYAAFAHAVMQRRREIAIRLAVGAAPSTVQAMILREAALLTLSGVALGIACALLASRWATSLLVAVRTADPLVLGSAAVLMLSIAVLATVVPARTAASTAPSVLLRD